MEPTTTYESERHEEALERMRWGAEAWTVVVIDPPLVGPLA